MNHSIDLFADENTIEISPPNMGDWNAVDLDVPDVDYQDRITYEIEDLIVVNIAGRSGASCSVRAQVNVDGNLSLLCSKLDFKVASEYVVTVKASDGWDAVECLIKITPRNENELMWNRTTFDGLRLEKEHPEIRLVSTDGPFTLELSRYTIDPEQDPISFEAYTDIGTQILSVKGSTLTQWVTGCCGRMR